MQDTSNNYDIVSDMFAHNYLLYYFPMECITRRLLVTLGELSIQELLAFEVYKNILKIPTLQSDDGYPPDINYIFKRCFFDAIIRPLNFKDLIRFSHMQNVGDFKKLTRSYINQIASEASMKFCVHLGEISEFSIDIETLNLTRAILLSKPSQRIMASMHDDYPLNSIFHMIIQSKIFVCYGLDTIVMTIIFNNILLIS